MNDAIPVIEIYRDVGIHVDQSKVRVDTVVKPAIDTVYSIADMDRLLEFSGSAWHPPEARLFASAKAEALFGMAVDERRARPKFDLADIRARVAGLASLKWRHPRLFCSLLDTLPAPGQRGPDRRDVSLTETLS